MTLISGYVNAKKYSEDNDVSLEVILAISKKSKNKELLVTIGKEYFLNEKFIAIEAKAYLDDKVKRKKIRSLKVSIKNTIKLSNSETDPTKKNELTKSISDLEKNIQQYEPNYKRPTA